MKVYVVMYAGYYYEEPSGVFSSEDKALAYIETRPKPDRIDYKVIEMDVN